MSRVSTSSRLTYFNHHSLLCHPTPAGMPYTTNTGDLSSLPCYFTYNPPVYDLFSVETPPASPVHSPGDPDCNAQHPLLAYRPSQATNARNTATIDFFKMQTAAAHGSPIRPRPVPQQNLLQVTSDDSSSSSSSISSGSSSRSSLDMFSAPEIARCSRCQRTPSTDVRTGKTNMVQYGLNLWYCSRCASMVGLTQG